jgi:hypothetical protein
MAIGNPCGPSQKLVLQYRYGLLPTYNLLKRYKKADSSICPLCGQEDGGHHAMSGCSKLLKNATLRHNNAGTLIAEAIYTGEHGHKLIAADVGLKQPRRAKGQQELDIARTIPDTALPKTIPAEVRLQMRKQSIPDALMYHFDRKSRKRQYTIIEIKYCRDTRREDQETKAVAQHQRLVDTLKKHDPEATVKHHNILLGVGGAIYTDMVNTMKDELGVTGRSLDTLLRKLHYTAVEEVGNMWKHRRAKLHNKLGAK